MKKAKPEFYFHIQEVLQNQVHVIVCVRFPTIDKDFAFMRSCIGKDKILQAVKLVTQLTGKRPELPDVLKHYLKKEKPNAIQAPAPILAFPQAAPDESKGNMDQANPGHSEGPCGSDGPRCDCGGEPGEEGPAGIEAEPSCAGPRPDYPEEEGSVPANAPA